MSIALLGQPLTQLLQADSGPWTQVMGFLGTEVAQVSKAFYKHSRNAMGQVALQIKMANPSSVISLREVENRLPPDIRSADVLAQEITDKLINASAINVLSAVQKESLHTFWWRISELLKSLTQKKRLKRIRFGSIACMRLMSI